MDPRIAHAPEGRYTIDREMGRGGIEEMSVCHYSA